MWHGSRWLTRSGPWIVGVAALATLALAYTLTRSDAAPVGHSVDVALGNATLETITLSIDLGVADRVPGRLTLDAACVSGPITAYISSTADGSVRSGAPAQDEDPDPGRVRQGLTCENGRTALVADLDLSEDDIVSTLGRGRDYFDLSLDAVSLTEPPSPDPRVVLKVSGGPYDRFEDLFGSAAASSGSSASWDGRRNVQASGVVTQLDVVARVKSLLDLALLVLGVLLGLLPAAYTRSRPARLVPTTHDAPPRRRARTKLLSARPPAVWPRKHW